MSGPSEGTVVITGASSGIGRATARAFGERGYRTLLLARRAEPMVQLGLPNSTCTAADVTNGRALQETIRDYERSEGPISLLVNNAGIMPLGKIHDQDPAEWAAAFETNALSVLHAAQAVLPGMMERRTGTVVSISSTAGRNVFANHTAYSGTKFAVHSMMESMRREYAAFGIRFSTVAPAIVDTNLLESVSDRTIIDSYQQVKDRLDGGLNADDIARAIVMLHEQPNDVCIREIVIGSTNQES